MTKISAVLLNWKRPEGVEKICKHLLQSDLIGEIIIWNNNADMSMSFDNEKTRIINCSEDFGLFTRFAAASLSKYPCILYHDDDIMAPETTLKELFKHWQKQPYSCHTSFGRNPKNGQYSKNTQYGPVEISLTRYVLIHRAVCVHALSKVPLFDDIRGIPVGNGEDIILSYAAMDYSGKLNRAYKLETKDLYHKDEHAISHRFPEHDAHRSRMIQRAYKVFKPKVHLKLWNRIYQFFVKVRIVFQRDILKKQITH